MKHFILALLTGCIWHASIAQDNHSLKIRNWPESDQDTAIYTIDGYRHGISFFPQIRYSEVEYEAGEQLTFNTFHSTDVINEWLKRFASQYPHLVELYEVGRSFEGRPIMQVTLTNKEKGRDTDKPAAYFEGGRHSGEITSCESVLWLIQHLVVHYGSDADITQILDTRTIYARPVNNPDGHNLYVHTAQSNRSTVRPTDNDQDGLLDEDAPDDLDGDGIILRMRWPDGKEGNYIPDPKDPSGRIMKRVPEGEGTYRMGSEGLDNDGDGRINEDGIGGLDLHRNYPENWRPDSQDEATGRGWTQRGAGAFPLSETETRSVVTFLLAHPNVYIINSMDTRVPMHLRAPSTSASEERMFEKDREWYEYFDTLGKQITGYERAGDVYEDYGGGNPLFGHGPDFGYWYFGAIWYGDELWNGGRFKDYDEDGEIDELDILRWDDEENNGDGFIEWKSAKHPEYGEVELGGFHPKFFSQNAPAKHLLPWAKNQALFNLEMVKHLPLLVWEDAEVHKLEEYGNDSTDFQVVVRFKNAGKLPTALEQAYLVKIVREDQVELEFEREWFRGESPALKILTEQQGRRRRSYYGDDGPGLQSSETKQCGFTDGGKSSTVEFKVRAYKTGTYTGTVQVQSTRAGVLPKRTIHLVF